MCWADVRLCGCRSERKGLAAEFPVAVVVFFEAQSLSLLLSVAIEYVHFNCGFVGISGYGFFGLDDFIALDAVFGFDALECLFPEYC